jgi:hypothetical protein
VPGRAFRRCSDHFLSQPTVVQCTFDGDAHTLRMEIFGEPEAGAVAFTKLPAAEFLCPLISLIEEDARVPALLFAMDSEDE